MMKLDDTRFTLIENKVFNKHDNGINAEFDNNFYCRHGDKKNALKLHLCFQKKLSDQNKMIL